LILHEINGCDPVLTMPCGRNVPYAKMLHFGNVGLDDGNLKQGIDNCVLTHCSRLASATE